MNVSQQLMEAGFAGPVPILSATQCRRFLAAVADRGRRPPLDWPKGSAATSRAFYEIATHPAILAIVEDALGEHVMLFGACVLTQRPGGDHPWHSDIETSGPGGKTLSVWIGLENVSADSGLQFVSRSHRFGATVQEVRQQMGVPRKGATTDAVIAWAKQRDAHAALVKPDVRDGEALFFQGQSWHHSSNTGGRLRRSLLLQYATPTTPIRMPDLNSVEWPFQYRQTPKPACIMINGSSGSGSGSSGSGSGNVNRIVPPPPRAAGGKKNQLSHQVCTIPPLAPDDGKPFKFHNMFTGCTSDLREMEVHASALANGQMPHPPHTHREEEILIMLSGEADLILPQVKGPHGDERFPLRPGEFVYYPSMFSHTLRTTSEQPANYLMFKWDTEPAPARTSAIPFGHYKAPEALAALSGPSESGFRTKKLFEGPTGCLRKLHAHVSVVQPGAGYDAHVDAYDVAIIVLEGEIETLEQRVGPRTTIYHAAGHAHGLRNPGQIPARYIVLEFHGSRAVQSEAFPKSPPTLTQKLMDPKQWMRKLKGVAKRLKGGGVS